MAEVQGTQGSDHPLSRDALKNAWDDRYREKGRQWGNAPSEFLSHDTGIILELGVGDGKNVRTRTKQNTHYIGLDFSFAALQLCQTDPELSGTDLMLADVCNLPILDTSIDLVYAHHILGHLPSHLQQNLMDEVFRVLKPMGSLALTVFASGDLRDGQGTEIEPATFLRGDGIITRYFTPRDIKELGNKFLIKNIEREEWTLLIRGIRHKRAVLTTVLEKPDTHHP